MDEKQEKHQTSSSSDSIHNDKEYYTGDVASVEQQESVEKKEPYKLKRTLKSRHLSVSIEIWIENAMHVQISDLL